MDKKPLIWAFLGGVDIFSAQNCYMANLLFDYAHSVKISAQTDPNSQFLAAVSSYILRSVRPSVRPSVRQKNVKKVYNAPQNASIDKINT